MEWSGSGLKVLYTCVETSCRKSERCKKGEVYVREVGGNVVRATVRESRYVGERTGEGNLREVI